MKKVSLLLRGGAVVARSIRSLLLGLALLPVGAALAQAPTWQVATSGNNFQPATTGTSVTSATAVDAATGNVYLTGSFTGEVTFGNSRLVSAGLSDVFVAKWDVTAGRFTSAVAEGGSGNDQGNGIAVVNVGGTSRVYVTGFFGSGTSASIAGTVLAGTGATNSDVFVARYTDAGTGLTAGGAVSGGSSGNDGGNGIAAVGTGGTTSVYITGFFLGSAGIAGATLTNAGSSGSDVFVAKYTDAGMGLTAGGAVSGGGTGADAGNGVAAVSVGATTSVYVTGYSDRGSVATLAGTAVITTGSGQNIFVARYTDAGTGLTDGGAVSYGRGGGGNNDRGQGIAAIGIGGTTSVYVTGIFVGGTTIAGTALPSSSYDVFVARYTDTGTGLTDGGAVRGGGPNGDQGYGVAVVSAGGTSSVYVTGKFSSGNSTTTASIAGSTLTGFGTNNSDVFVARYTDAGTGLTDGGAVGGGGNGDELGYGIAAGSSTVYAGGAVGTSVARFGSSPVRLAPPNSGVLGRFDAATLGWLGVEGPLQGGTSVTNATAVDPATGNVYVTGNFSGTVGFGTTRLVSKGSNDIFVARWDATAQAFTSAVSEGGTSDDAGYGIAVVSAGGTSSVYVTGSFSGNGVSIAGTALSSNNLASNITDMFVARYTDTGTGLTSGGAVNGGGIGGDDGYGIAAVGTGGTTSVYVTGAFANNGGTSIAGTPLTGTGLSPANDMFVARYTDAGTGLTNGGAVNGGGQGTDVGYSIAAVSVGGTNSVYVTGAFDTSNYAGSGPSIAGTSLPLNGTNYDMFVARYTDTGTGLTDGGAVSGGGNGTRDKGYGIAAVNAGGTTNIYVTGFFSASGSASIAGTTLVSAGGQDMFVARYADAGTGLTSGGAVPGGGTSADQGYGIAVSSAGGPNSVYVTGYFGSGSASIAGTTLTSAGGQDMFVARYTDAGTGLTNGAAASGGGAGADQGYGIAVDGATVYAGGAITPAATFGSFTVANPVATSLNFLGQLINACAPPVAVAQAVALPLAANGTATLTAAQVNNGSTAACGFARGGGLSVSPSAFTCANVGANTVTLTVTDVNGQTATATAIVTVSAPPTATLSGLSPNPATSGATVTATGTNLSGATALTVNGASAAISGLSATSFTFVVPAGATTSGNVVVSLPCSQSISQALAVAPTISGLSPGGGTVGSSLTITGSHLTGATTVTFSGTSNNTVTTGLTVSGTGSGQTLTVLVPGGATTGPVTVTTPSGTSNGVTFTVTVGITALSPPRNQRNAAAASDVAVTFSQPLQNTAATQGAVKVFSQQRGGRLMNGAGGTATVSGATLTFNPTNNFKPGETLFVTTTTAATATNGATLTHAHVHQFTTAVGGTGGGRFLPGTDPAVGTRPGTVVVGDVDGDGDLDLLTANNTANTVSVRLNGGNAGGTNTGVFSNGTDAAVGSGPYGMVLGDVDGDGDLDMLCTNIFANTVSVRLNGGDATGTNTGVFSNGSDPAVGSNPLSVALGDVDGDGDLDMLTANNIGGTVSVRLNGGDASGSNTGTFSNGSDPAVNSNPRSVAVGDVDGDGDLDLLVSTYQNNTVSVRLNGGDATGTNTGVFSNGSDPAVGNNPLTLALGDVDGDGDLDVLTANFNFNGTVSVRLNGGDASGSNTGVFSNGSDLAVGRFPRIALGDVDGDGDLDLLTANSNIGTVSVRLNGGDASGTNTGVFSNGSDPAVGAEPGSVALGDVDGDGDLDLLTANGSGAGTVSVRLNQPAAPTLTSLTPPSGVVGTSVTLTGSNLTGATAVTFTGTSNNTVTTGLTVSGSGSSQTITVLVPSGAATGPVTVTTPNGTSNGVAFTVTVNQAPTALALSNSSVAENAGANAAVGTLNSTDPDNSSGFTYTLVAGAGSTDNASFNLSGSSLRLTASADFETKSSYAVRVRTTDGGGLSFEQPFTISITNVNEAPVIATQTRSIAENSPNGTAVGTPLAASDPDAGSTLTYSITAGNGTGGGAFAINSSTGQLSVADVAQLDYETTPTFTLTVQVSDGSLNDNATVTINLTDVAEAVNLTVTTTANIPAGLYNNITVTGTGHATFTGAITLNGALLVQSGGSLNTNCQFLTGAGSFTLAAGATLGICDAAGIGSSGAVQTTGPRSFSSNASYLYNGTVAQATGAGLPASVRNLTTTNAQPVTLTQPVAVAQVLTVAGNGNVVLNGQALLLPSTTSGTALVANTGTGVVSGATATLQRHIETNIAASGYRHYASPMSGETVNTLATVGYAPDFSGAATYNTVAAPGLVTPFPTVFGYEQNRIATTISTYGTFDKGWQAAESGEAMPVGKGYAVQAPGAALMDFTGTPFTGPLAVASLARTGAADGWHLLGNPYPAPLDWSTMTMGAGANLENMDGAVYVFQSSGPYSGSYRTYLAALPGGNSPLVPAGSGFFVRTTAPGTPGTVRFANVNRITTFGTQPAFGRSNDTRPVLTLTLAGTTGPADAFTLYTDLAATAGVDAAYDATKLANPSGLNLAALAGSTPLAIAGLPVLTGTTVVPLTLAVPAAGTYTLAVVALANFGATQVALRDAQAGTEQPLAAGTSVRVTLPAGALATGRFSLVLRPAGALATAGSTLAAQVRLFPNPAHGSFTLTLPPVAAATAATATLVNALGQVLNTRTLALTAGGATAEYATAGLAAGVYALRVSAGKEQATIRVVVK